MVSVLGRKLASLLNIRTQFWGADLRGKKICQYILDMGWSLVCYLKLSRVRCGQCRNGRLSVKLGKKWFSSLVSGACFSEVSGSQRVVGD